MDPRQPFLLAVAVLLVMLFFLSHMLRNVCKNTQAVWMKLIPSRSSSLTKIEAYNNITKPVKMKHLEEYFLSSAMAV